MPRMQKVDLKPSPTRAVGGAVWISPASWVRAAQRANIESMQIAFQILSLKITCCHVRRLPRSF
jgi:hypothetical protein